MEVRKDAGCYVSFLVSVESFFVSEHVGNFGESSTMCREGVLFYLGVKCSVNISLVLLAFNVSSSISLLSFCLNDLSIGESRILKSPTISV